MKKRYICPKTEAIQIETTKMIAFSAELDAQRSITTSDGFGSRRGGGFFNDDDWDED